MTAREKFQIGDRVRLTDAYVARLRNKRWAAHRFARVVGFCMHPKGVRVLREGFRFSALRWSADDWDVVDPAGPGRYTHLVVIAREGVPEVRGFHDYASAFAWYDSAGTQWSESFLTEVVKGPLV